MKNCIMVIIVTLMSPVMMEPVGMMKLMRSMVGSKTDSKLVMSYQKTVKHYI